MWFYRPIPVFGIDPRYRTSGIDDFGVVLPTTTLNEVRVRTCRQLLAVPVGQVFTGPLFLNDNQYSFNDVI